MVLPALSSEYVFGSSNGMFERISAEVGNRTVAGERYVVLDFNDVSGCDTSALLSIVKLRNWGREHTVRLVWAGLADEMRATLARAGLFDDREPAIFPTRTEAIEWCEERVLSEATLYEARAELAPFEDWLGDVLGQEPAERLLRDYLERRRTSQQTRDVSLFAATLDLLTLLNEQTTSSPVVSVKWTCPLPCLRPFFICPK